VVYITSTLQGETVTSYAPPQTVTVAYCPCYPGMKFARQDSGEFVYQHCDC
jgi:hypothetical protein